MDEFEDEGLTIVGVASESESQTDPWIEEQGARYAYAFDHSKKLMRAVGARGFPSAVVVDPQGNIAWSGHPSRINGALLKPLLEGALKTPMYDWPKSCSKVAKALRKGNLGDAIKASAKIEEEHPDIAAAVVGMADGRLNSMEKAAAEGDWLKVQRIGESLEDAVKVWSGGEKVTAILDELKGDKDAQAILKAQVKVAKLIEGPVKSSRYERTKKELEKIRDKHRGTAAERDARAAIEKLKESKRR